MIPLNRHRGTAPKIIENEIRKPVIKKKEKIAIFTLFFLNGGLYSRAVSPAQGIGTKIDPKNLCYTITRIPRSSKFIVFTNSKTIMINLLSWNIRIVPQFI